MIIKRKGILLSVLIGTGIMSLAGCGGGFESNPAENTGISSVDGIVAEASAGRRLRPFYRKNIYGGESGKTGKMPGKPEIPEEENGILEIYAGGGRITVPEEVLAAQIAPQEILMGDPVLYDRFRVGGWVFEWLVSDYDDGNWFTEDCVLAVSHEGEPEDAQIIHVTAEGGYGTPVPVKNKFEYVDVNFDNIPDLLICTGHHGNQGAITYYCFIQTEDGFAEAPTFTEIPNPAIDAGNQLILSQWRNSAASHSWAEYQCQDDTYVRYRELCEEMDFSGDKEVWVWTVNGEEAARSDELSEEEIEEFLCGKNSEWKLADDRWTADYSIYDGP